MRMKNNDVHKQIKDVLFYLKKIFSIFGYIFLVLALLFIANYFIEVGTSIVKGTEHKPTFSLYTVLTGSMVPNINVDDIVFDMKVNKPEDIKVGDVITFISTSSYMNGATITHRVMDIKKVGTEYEFYTKGDANQSADSTPAEFSKIIGKVLFRIPKVGFFQKLLSNRIGWLFLVLIPVLGTILFDAFNVKKVIKINKKSDVISTTTKETPKKDVSKLKAELLSKRQL